MAASRAAVRAGYRTLWRTATNTFRGDTRAIVAGRMELRDHVEKERNEKDPAKIGEGVIEGRRLPASVGGTVWRGLGGVLNVRRCHACCDMVSELLFVHAYCRRPSLLLYPSFYPSVSLRPMCRLLYSQSLPHCIRTCPFSKQQRNSSRCVVFPHDRDRARVNASP